MPSTLPLLPVLFQDRRFVVIDKPAGIPVHATRQGGPDVESILRQSLALREGPWLVHRLDTDTAGCLVVALRRSALRAAQTAFATRSVRKTYWAVVRGRPPATTGVVSGPLSRIGSGKGWRMAVRPEGQAAETAWRLCGFADKLAWLELEPRTGRTHQVRVHCAALGCPVVGDAIYGGGKAPLHLLARSVAIPLDPPVTATAPVPAHMRAALVACGLDQKSE